MFKFRKGTWNYMYSAPISINRGESFFFIYVTYLYVHVLLGKLQKYKKRINEQISCIGQISVNFLFSLLRTKALLVMEYTVNGKYRHIHLYK